MDNKNCLRQQRCYLIKSQRGNVNPASINVKLKAPCSLQPSQDVDKQQI